MKRISKILSVGTVSAIVSCANFTYADTNFTSAKKIDEVVQELMRVQSIPGAAVTVLENGKPVYTQTYGTSNLELKTPVLPGSIFQSGSVGKMFTSAALMLLAQDGKIKLDDPISPYFPEAKGMWDGITIRQVMMHRSGIPDYENMTTIDIQQDYSDEKLISLLSADKLDFNPGTQYRYSNSGYVALGVLIKRVSGEFYGDFLRKRVFEPCGMNTAQVNVLKMIKPGRAAGYVMGDSGLENVGPVSQSLAQTADGSLLISINDIAKWDQCIDKGTVFSKSAMEMAWNVPPMPDGRRPIVGYGFGWMNNVKNRQKIIQHGGSFQGFHAHYARFDNGLSIGFLANLESARGNYIARRIAGVIKPELLPPEKEIPGTEGETKRFKSALIALMSGVDDQLLSNEVRDVYNKKYIDEIYGTFKKITDETELKQVGAWQEGTLQHKLYSVAAKRVYYVDAIFKNEKIASIEFSSE